MTSIVSKVESSEVFLIKIFPVSTSTVSENVRLISLSIAIAIELLDGKLLLRVGVISSISATVTVTV